MFSSLYRPAHHILYQNSHPHDVRDPAKQYKDEFSFVYFQRTPLLFTILADGLCSSVFICRRARGSSGIDDTADTGVISGAGGRLNKDLLLSEREHSKSKDTRALINRKKPQRVSNKAGLICYSILLFLSLFSSALSLSVRVVVVVVVVFLSLKSSLSHPQTSRSGSRRAPFDRAVSVVTRRDCVRRPAEKFPFSKIPNLTRSSVSDTFSTRVTRLRLLPIL